MTIGRTTNPHHLSCRVRLSALPLLALLLVGCASNTKRANWEGPQVAQPVTFEAWKYHDEPGRTVKSAHYTIHTTITDTQLLTRLAQVMEGGLQQYERFTPGLPITNRPMDCFVFATRPQWMAFTKEHTGNDAVVYLKINRGGYTVRDWFVSYLLSDESTFAVAAHEGWHQYVARHFKERLPPFLEEGIATQFENMHWTGDLPRWNLSINAARAQRLRQAIEGKYLWPLDQLVTMHAGDVVGLSGERIEAFYAQNWAFVRFLWDADNGKYRQAFQQMLIDTANGVSWKGDASADTPPPRRTIL